MSERTRRETEKARRRQYALYLMQKYAVEQEAPVPEYEQRIRCARDLMSMMEEKDG